jgi:hypothetical protein
MAKEGTPIRANDVASVGIYFVPYTGEAFQFEPAEERLALKGKITCDATGKCTSVLEGEGDLYTVNYRNVNGLVVIYTVEMVM